MSSNNRNPIEQTASDTLDYAKLKIEKVKLRVLDNLSTTLSTIFAVLLVVISLCMAIIFLAVAATWGLGMLIGSFIGAVLIMAGVFIIIAIIIYACRKTIVVNPVVRMFVKVFFEKEEDYE